LTADHDVSVVLMRRLIPAALYPGRRRVGAPITVRSTAEFAPTFDGVDWYGLPSLPRALRFLRAQQPEVVILQWWTGAVLPWYLAISRSARRAGATVVVEFHEDLDSGEAAIPLVAPAVRRGLRRLLRAADGFVAHSEWDRERFIQRFGLSPERFHAIPLGPMPLAGQLPAGGSVPTARAGGDSGEITVLFFGTIRPYKGLEHLVEAFDRLPRGSQRWRLLIVGEPWEGWTAPFEAITASPHRADIELVDRYVGDDEVPGLFDRADVVALPYLRSSASGPLHLSMSRGVPVVLSQVGGLAEAAEGYGGAVLVPPADPVALAEGIVAATRLCGVRHVEPRSWTDTAAAYAALFEPQRPMAPVAR
jgi:glycosyltransferase involved in cell wall biosynthesis